MQETPPRAEREWLERYADLERRVRLDMLTQAFAASGLEPLDGEHPLDVGCAEDDTAAATARAFLEEPALASLPMSEFMLVSDFVEAGWEFCLADLVDALERGVTLRAHLTRLVARRLGGVVTHFGLDPAEILSCLGADTSAAPE